MELESIDSSRESPPNGTEVSTLKVDRFVVGSPKETPFTLRLPLDHNSASQALLFEKD